MKRLTDDRKFRELRVISTNGRSQLMALPVLEEMLSSKLVWLVFLLFSCLLSLLDSPIAGVHLEMVGRFVFWFFDCVVVTVLWYVQFRLALWVNLRFGWNLPIFVIAACSVGMAAAVWANYAIAASLFESAPLKAMDVWTEFLRYMLMALILELFFISFVLPRFEGIRSIPPKQTPKDRLAPLPSPQLVVLNGRRIELSGLLYIKTVDAYVDFVFEIDQMLERADLDTLEPQLGDVDGIRCHPGFWVPRRSVKSMRVRAEKPVLVLVDGTQIPVAVDRFTEVQAWWEDQG